MADGRQPAAHQEAAYRLLTLRRFYSRNRKTQSQESSQRQKGSGEEGCLCRRGRTAGMRARAEGGATAHPAVRYSILWEYAGQYPQGHKGEQGQEPPKEQPESRFLEEACQKKDVQGLKEPEGQNGSHAEETGRGPSPQNTLPEYYYAYPSSWQTDHDGCLRLS
eukprot:scaffold1664_cov351-Prasinococcus_capsulatus_cf.AAC.2